MSRVFVAVAGSAGVVAGPATVLSTVAAENGREATKTAAEALDEVAAELSSLAEKMRAAGRPDEAEILEVESMLATDPMLRDEIEIELQHGASPVAAVTTVTDRQAAVIAALPDPMLSERAADIRQIGRQANARLTGTTQTNVAEDRVLIAEELGPADLIAGDAPPRAAISVKGGPSSHTAIVARSFGIPLVFCNDPDVLQTAQDMMVVVDADGGRVVVEPEPSELSAVSRAMDVAQKKREAIAAERELSCETLDGIPVTLLCNVASESEIDTGLESGAEGVGLLRTELPFLHAKEWPNEEAHYKVLEPLLTKLRGKTATVRALDFGADKVPPFLAVAAVAGDVEPRGLPALLSSPGALSNQLKAILRAGADTQLRILVPMVSSLREVRLARDELVRAAAELELDPPEFGVMIELPSAALLVDRLVEEVDFLSIGSNDLTQYSLAIDRRQAAAQPALTAHPAVLRSIQRVARAGQRAGRPAGVCGEAASDPLVLPLILGAGVRLVSVAPARVDMVRATVRRLSMSQCEQLMAKAVLCNSVEEVWDLVRASGAADVLDET